MPKDMNFDTYPQKPHGGVLVDQVVPAGQRDAEIARARNLPSIRVDLEAVITIEMIATGVLSPNTGFMNEADYNSVLSEGRLANGTIWPVPLSFAPVGSKNAEIIKTLSVGDEVALTDSNNDPVAILTLSDIFDYDKDGRAQKLFGTSDRSHPGVDSIYRRMGDTSLAGPVVLLKRADWGPFEKIRQEPKDTWRMFYDERKFTSVAGFITGANPLHRGHEYIHKNALEEVDGLFVQPLVEMAKREYVRHEFRMLAYRSVLDTYYPDTRAMMAPLRVTYIFAGPREAILHALIMKNYGCTHALIGRDHAGVGSFYDKYAGHSIFDNYSAEELGIDIRLFHEVFYCARCSSHATEKTCSHDAQYRLGISGTGIREMLRHGILPPKEVVRPEAARIAIQGVQPKGVDEAGEGTLPVAKVVQSMYPFYREHTRFGGPKRATPLAPEDLTVRDLEAASLDVRSNAHMVYSDVYNEYSSLADHNLSLQRTWITEARATIKAHQQMVLSDLEEKLAMAPAEASDEFMYQDKSETEREVVAAKLHLDAAPPVTAGDTLSAKVWNPLPYHRYRGIDD
ncbi:sulfate adenylyltransferase [Pararhodobacter oceanensis]|uniref:sulfate adenylyltransferase n=1 Tax=Pararhodobacter oceanensis TaxID=2172121 RepID=UPI003A93E0AD